MWRRLGLAATVLALLAHPAPPAPAAAPKKGKAPVSKRPPREFFGVQSFQALSLGELAALRNARIGTHRTVIFWHAVEPSRGARDWSYSDYEVAAAAKYGLRTLPFLYGMAPPYGDRPAQPPVYSDDALAGWRAFAADAARRYGAGGEFWRLHPELPYRPVTRWQVWNEPSNPLFWDGTPNVGAYAKLLRETADAIRSGDPAAGIVLAGLLPNANDPTGIPLRRFLGELYAQPGIKSQFDAVAVHPYAMSPKKAVRAVQAARKAMDRNGDRRTPIWVTEMGWATGGTQGARPIITSLAGQARSLRRAYTLMLAIRGQLRLAGIVWFSMRDYNAGRDDLWIQHMGLFKVGKEAKPAWHALARITGGKATGIVEPPAVAPPPPPPTPPGSPCPLLIFC